MTDEHAESDVQERSWLERLSHLLLGEPQDQNDLLELLENAKDRKVLDEDALSMIEGVLGVSKYQVRDIMIPRSQMVIIERDETLESLLPKVIESGHSRFPVIGDDRDDVLGVLLAKDLLHYTNSSQGERFSVKDILREATVVPESKRLNILLNEFRAKRNHMAIVVDEYGGVSGLVTIEDVLEEIVGEIADEHDIEEEDTNIKRNSKTEYVIKALTPIEEFNEFFSAELSDDEFDTIGGLVTNAFGHLPKAGETLTIEDYTFTVQRTAQRRLSSLLINTKSVPVKT